MRIAIIALTKNASKLANEIGQKLKGDVYVKEKYAVSGNYAIEGDFVEFVHKIFSKYEGLVFVMATGIVVRAIAGVVKDKFTDPAVVVVDEKGRFAISLLSGHVGGANRLALTVASIISAQPVITTATDIEGVISLDVIAKDYGYQIENIEDLKKVSAALVNGENVRFVFDEDVEEIPLLKDYVKNDDDGEVDAFVYVTDKEIKKLLEKPYVILRPKNIVIGLGCKKGIAFEDLLTFVSETFKNLNLSLKSIKSIATIDIKKEEKGIHQLAEFLKVPVVFYTKEDLKKVENKFPISDFVFHTVGVGSVARPSAYLSSDGGKEIAYLKKDGITLAIYKSRKKD
ncbi:cobalt-precorrin 5A hydrolase [Thermoanaerobacter sp. A7A]|uniref:cobalt-precorrin 5A hydrolase n=1 Tax=Thermoanaerobacter sp. A7A TaxID=1350366 RepID=UPI00041FA713|nr:cobalt-precorrin 5A hydrolase [Thermoanaerobacter sp. A7A]